MLIHPRLTDYHGVAAAQEDVDFAIPFFAEDIPLFLDPFLLWRSPSHQDQALHIALMAAFNRLGHEAWSVDLLPADDRSNMHIVGDIREYLHAGNWDMLCVFHPPCTRLCNSGVRWLHQPPPGRTKRISTLSIRTGRRSYDRVDHPPLPFTSRKDSGAGRRRAPEPPRRWRARR